MLSKQFIRLISFLGLLLLLYACVAQSALVNNGAILEVRQDGTKARAQALLDSAMKDDIAMIKQLLAAGANPNVKDTRSGHTPLIIATIRGRKDIVQLLLDSGADVNATDDFGYTALRAAVMSNRPDIAALLLERKASAEIKDKNGRTALHDAVEHENIKIVELLLLKGADANARDLSGETPLFKASSLDIKIAGLLLDRGADINVRNINGRSPLAEAVNKRYIPGVQLLLSRGADVNAKDTDDWTPLKEALLMGCPDIANLLEEAGAQE